MNDPAVGPDDAADQFWEIRLGVSCTGPQARALVDRIQLLLCPDPDHAPPCPVPWSVAHWSLDEEEAADAYPGLVEQARIERRLR